MKSTSGPTAAQERTVATDDGSLTYRLMASRKGLVVERIRHRKKTGRVAVSALFADEQSFGRWCDADPVRFEHPLVHFRLRKEGQELLDEQS